MKTARFSNPRPFIIQKLITLFLLAAVVTSSFATVTSLADGKKKPSRLTDNQRIIHVLNRLGFGARPGDLERVKAMGLENYIKQQLNPENIPDTLAENRVAGLSSINMTTAQLYEKYPQPGQLLRQLQARGVLPSDLA